MALVNRERFTDERGEVYVLERRDHGDGDVDYYLSLPDGRTTKVRRELVR